MQALIVVSQRHSDSLKPALVLLCALTTNLILQQLTLSQLIARQCVFP